MTTNINQVPESVIDKIRKLLELSKSNYEGESDSAMCKAKELATRFQIDIASIKETNTKSEPIVEEMGISLGKRRPITQNLISNILRNHFNVRVIYWGNRDSGRSMSLIGTKPDIEMAKFVNSFLKDSFMSRWHTYFERTCCPLDYRNSYLYGLSRGLDEKLTEAKKKTESSSFEEIKANKGLLESEQVKQNYSLMVINKDKQLDTEMRRLHPKLGKAKSAPKTYRTDVISDGHKEGRNINILRPVGYNQANQLYA